MGLTHSPLTPTNGLVLCLDSANRRSYPGTGTSWRDLSGNGNDGILTNGVTYSGQKIGFDGIDDQIQTGCKLPSGPHTISCWVYKRSTNSTLGFIIAQRNATNARFQLFLRGDAGIDPLKLRYFNGTTVFSGNGGIVAANVKWQHLVATYDGSNLRLYIDGLLDSTQAITDGPTINEGVDIGGNTTGGFSNCLIEDIRIYNRALTAGEILALYNYKRKFFTQ